ncbi:MAG TPA: hypothetical protein VHS74_06725 [Solirubrobacterales bacterium]|jgi:hypothetical protein|nr:hypothetical protein [Solirubrobacterales bacterium]
MGEGVEPLRPVDWEASAREAGGVALWRETIDLPIPFNAEHHIQPLLFHIYRLEQEGVLELRITGDEPGEETELFIDEADLDTARREAHAPLSMNAARTGAVEVVLMHYDPLGRDPEDESLTMFMREGEQGRLMIYLADGEGSIFALFHIRESDLDTARREAHERVP